MEVLGAIGALLIFVGWIWLLMLAFGKNFWIGCAGLLLTPLVLPIFALFHLRETWKPLLLAIVGIVLFGEAGGFS